MLRKHFLRTTDLQQHLCVVAFLFLIYIPPTSLNAATDNSSNPVMKKTFNSSSSSAASQLSHANRYQSFRTIEMAAAHPCFSQTHVAIDEALCVANGEQQRVVNGDECCVDSSVLPPSGPLLPCEFLPSDFIECDEPVDHKSMCNRESSLDAQVGSDQS